MRVQALEGLALSSVIALSFMPLWRKLLLAACYSVTLPLGIAIGIAVSASYNPGGQLPAPAWALGCTWAA